jgi:hypothetical protein
MSTRANIVLKESYSYKAKNGKRVVKNQELIFYKHSDGYPEGVMPILNKFMEWIKEGKIRDNVSQAGGWLILLGAMEYNTMPNFETEKAHFEGGKAYGNIDTIEAPKDWKCGAYEPTTGIHGDIEFLYEVDLTNKEIIVKQEQILTYEPLKTAWVEVNVSNLAKIPR